MPFGGALTVGLIGAGSSLFSGLFGASQAQKAAQAQTKQEQAALDFQKAVYGDTVANQRPFVDAGQFALARLEGGFSDGTFGAGSIKPPPTFTAPTLEDARNTPGYQFTQQQGEQGILRGSAAAGGAFSGGTLKSLSRFDTGLADSTYNDVFGRALQGYGTAMQGYQAQLAAQNQAFNQTSAVAGLGENAAANVGNAGAQASTTIGNTLGSIGNSQSAGIIGSTNAITGGIQGAVNGATVPFYLQQLTAQQGGTLPNGGNAANGYQVPGTYNVPQQYSAPPVDLGEGG